MIGSLAMKQLVASLAACVVVVLAMLPFPGLAQGQVPTTPGERSAREIFWSGAPDRCDFSRIAIRPGGQEFLLWLDRRPNARTYSGYHPASTVAWVQQPQGSVSFISLDGEISALNWLEDAGTAEFLIDGRLHALFTPEDGQITTRPVGPAWRAIGIKNLRWGGLSATLQDRALTASMPQGLRDINRRYGFVLSAEHREYHPLAPDEGRVPPSILDRFYPESDYTGGGLKPEPADPALPARPIFDGRSGSVVGWQDARALYDVNGQEQSQAQGIPGALFRDVVALGDLRAILSARADGSHWLSVAGSGESWSRQICGPSPGRSQSEIVTIAAGGIDYPAFLHRSGEQDHLVVRFHGGPYGSILDDYPSRAAQRVAELGGAILEVSSPGSRHDAGAPAPRADRRKLRAYSTALAQWITRAGFRSVTVLGESFGAAGAVDYGLVDRERVRRLVLMVPLTSFDPERGLAGGPLLRESLTWSAEAMILGDELGRSQFARWLEESVAQACRELPVIAVVGAEDVTTPPDRQAKCIQERMIVVAGANHATVQDSEEAWRWLVAAEAAVQPR